MKRQTKFGIVLAAAAVISVSVASLVCARGWVQQGADWYYADSSNEFVTETIQASGNSKFYLDQDGRMVRDYFLEDYNGNTYYFGSNGAMVTNTWVAIDSALVENQDDYVPDNYWYYFQSSGKAMKAGSGNVKKTTIDGKKYAFNEFGQMCVGWIDLTGKTINPDDDSNPFVNAVYYAGGDNDGVLRAGWVTYYDGYDGDASTDYQADYTNLYFYFNTSNNTKINGQTKKINGRTYAFNDEGIMMSKWDPYLHDDQIANYSTSVPVYFSGEDDGHQVKKGWVYAVPTADMDSKAYDDDEEKYMYFNNSGDVVRDTFKKINGKYYVFNRTGIMKTGLVIWCSEGTTAETTTTSPAKYNYIDKLDLDWAKGEDIAKRGIYTTDRDVRIKVDTDGRVISGGTNNSHVRAGDFVRLHNFGEDGARKTGLNSIEFSDDSYTINTVGASGDKGTGVFAKKYYSLGILLKASADIRYGIYQQATVSMLTAQSGNWDEDLANGGYLVLTTSGAKQKGNKSAKKDADGNYWMISSDDSTLRGIYTVNIKDNNNLNGFKTRTYSRSKDGNPPANNIVPDKDGRFTAVSSQILNGWDGNIFSGDYTGEEISGAAWHLYESQDKSTYYFQCDYQGPCFQSDYLEGSNKWIPFGVLDNAKKSATFRFADSQKTKADGTTPLFTQATDPASFAYAFTENGGAQTPTNDYFLNCTWNG